MTDLYHKGYRDAVKEFDQALTSALNRNESTLEQMNHLIAYTHGMSLRSSQQEEPTQEITFDDFLQHLQFNHFKGGM